MPNPIQRSNRRSRPPSHKAIAEAQAGLLEDNPHVHERFDLAEAHRACWGCGYTAPTFKPEKGHIIAHAAGGPNEPSNYFLLCSHCHRDQPDGASREAQIFWLNHHESFWDRAYRATLRSQNALHEYAEEHGVSFLLESFAEQCLAQDIDGMIRTAARTSGAAQPKNIMSTIEFWFLQEFIKFVEFKRQDGWVEHREPPALVER